MDRIIAKLKSEPVRVRLYSVAALVTAYLAAKHVITATDATFYVSLAGVVLAVETARRKVTPTN